MDNFADLSIPVLVAIVFALLVLIILMKGFRLPGISSGASRDELYTKDSRSSKMRLIFTEEDEKGGGKGRG